MSGLVSTTVPWRRTQRRCSAGVSPSYTATRASRIPAPSAIAVMFVSWSAASALVGERYSAVARRASGSCSRAPIAVSTGSR